MAGCKLSARRRPSRVIRNGEPSSAHPPLSCNIDHLQRSDVRKGGVEEIWTQSYRWLHKTTSMGRFERFPKPERERDSQLFDLYSRAGQISRGPQDHLLDMIYDDSVDKSQDADRA